MQEQNQNGVEGQGISTKDYINGWREGYKSGYHDALEQAKVMKQAKVKATAARRTHRDAEKYVREIREALEKNRQLTQKQLYEMIGGTPVNLQKQLASLIDNRIVRKNGTGKRGSPYLYELYPEARNFSIINRKPDGTVIRTIRSGSFNNFPMNAGEADKNDTLNYTKAPLMDMARIK